MLQVQTLATPLFVRGGKSGSHETDEIIVRSARRKTRPRRDVLQGNRPLATLHDAECGFEAGGRRRPRDCGDVEDRPQHRPGQSKRAAAAGLSWPLPGNLTDAAL